MHACEPLRMPNKKIVSFWMGVTCLDPNVNYFKRLGIQQSQRTEECLSLWPDASQGGLSLHAVKIISRFAGWKTPFFIPQVDGMFFGRVHIRFSYFLRTIWNAMR
jgi:hypothetical protein